MSDELKPAAWVVKLRYGENSDGSIRWSGEMLTDVLPSKEKGNYQIIKPLYDVPRTSSADMLAEAAKKLKDQMCEGFCRDLPSEGTYDPKMDLDCVVCHIRKALAAHDANDHEDVGR